MFDKTHSVSDLGGTKELGSRAGYIPPRAVMFNLVTLVTYIYAVISNRNWDFFFIFIFWQASIWVDGILSDGIQNLCFSYFSRIIHCEKRK